MTRVRVEGFTISLDGYGAGPNQDIRNPLGVGGTDLHQWLVPTRTFQRTLFGVDGGTTGIDDDFAARGFKNVGSLDSRKKHVRTDSRFLARHELERLVGGQPTLSRSNFHLDSSRAPADPDGKAERHSTSSRAVFTRRLTGRATQPTQWMCALAADLTLFSNIFVRASSMSCTSLSRRSCWAGESDCSRGLTCALWDTNAFSSLRRRKPPMLYSGAKGTDA